ncbi:MAG: dihydrodipicolinate synthase family protein [Chthoniobacterales bacterium]|nr:dihydrodipicolinate synthase family protein [Chthoniobacterales bacterium]
MLSMETKMIRKLLAEGQVIPAQPLALDTRRRLSEKHQRAISRYYLEAGAGGLAVGVHSTQFEIREPQHGLFEPVLALASEEIDRHVARTGRPVLKIAGLCGNTSQAVAEAGLAARLGYHAGLLSLAAMKEATLDELVDHCAEVARHFPVVGFYLQPAAGGLILPSAFWRRFAEIDNVVAIKMAPFNRYQTIDVVRAVIEAGRDDIALYTGNDDSIVTDLLTPWVFPHRGRLVHRHIAGGLLGHWGVWTRRAVDQLERIKAARDGKQISAEWLAEAVAVTDMNAALFDAANKFHGCIPGILEVLRRQGLAPSICCLNPKETLSPGQAEELDRVIAAYPHLVDDDFVAANLDRWLS